MWRWGRKTEPAAGGGNVGALGTMDMCELALWATPAVREQEEVGEQCREEGAMKETSSFIDRN